MTRIRFTAVAVCLSMLAGSAAVADFVTLSDGSRLVGKVERAGDGKLLLHTQFAGTIELDATMVTQIEIDSRVFVNMNTGDTLVGTVEFNPALERSVVRTELGDIPILAENIAAIWPEDGKSPEQLAYELRSEELRQEMDKKIGKWSATFEAGAVLKEGNTDQLQARGKGELRRKSDRDLLRFYVMGAYTEQNDRRSESEVKGGIYYEYLLTERFFMFAKGELEYDEFENLDLRVTAVFGPGYYWIKEEDHELKTSAGFGYQHESFMDGTTTDNAIMELGLGYRLDIKPWLRFTNETYYYPTFDSIDDYRLNSDFAIVVPLGDSDMWKVKFGVLFEYDSIPRPGLKRLDLTYYGSVVVDIK